VSSSARISKRLARALIVAAFTVAYSLTQFARIRPENEQARILHAHLDAKIRLRRMKQTIGDC
jgi:hypothetical protein